MVTVFDRLRAWGCDVDGARARFMDDDAFYLSLLPRVVDDPGFDALGRALDDGQVQDAFEQGHALKGVLGNMGLTPLYACASALVEPLRAGSLEGTARSYATFLSLREELREIIR